MLGIRSEVVVLGIAYIIISLGESYKINNLDEYCIYIYRKCYYDNRNALFSVCEKTVSPQNNFILTSTNSNNMIATTFSDPYSSYMPEIPFEKVFKHD